jgi:putative membrane protein
MRLWKSGLAVVAMTGLGLAAGCSSQDADETDAAAMDSIPAATAPAPSATLTDAQILAIVVAANSADSAAGEMAQEKGTDPEVKSFGATMVKDHGALNKQGSDWAASAGVTPEESDASRDLTTNASNAATELQGKSGAEFDKAYIDHEVEMHQTVLDALDQQLIPSAQNPDLKNLLTQARGGIQSHLDMAKSIQTRLNQ